MCVHVGAGMFVYWCVYVCVCACMRVCMLVCALWKLLITMYVCIFLKQSLNIVKQIVATTFWIFYTSPNIDVVNGCGLNNEAHNEFPPKKTNVRLHVLAVLFIL